MMLILIIGACISLVGLIAYFEFFRDRKPRVSASKDPSAVEEIAEAIAASLSEAEEPVSEEIVLEDTEQEKDIEEEEEEDKIIENPINNYYVLDRLDEEQRKNLTRKLSGMPPLPRATMNLLPMLSNPKTNARDIAEVVTSDPLLAGKVLRRVNSSYYALEEKIDSIHHAVMLIGFDNIRSITLRESFDSMVNPEPVEDLTANKLWSHSAAISLFAKHLATKARGVDPEQASTAGLLHDIGLLVLMATEGKRLAKCLQLSAEECIPVCEAEGKEFGYNHQVIGEMLVRSWNLSEELASAIGRHHSPYSTEEPNPVASMIWFAHAAASRFGYTYRLISYPKDESERLAELLGLRWPVYEHITEGLIRELQKATSLWETRQSEDDIVAEDGELASDLERIES